jgi:hypothetical protein
MSIRKFDITKLKQFYQFSKEIDFKDLKSLI